MSRQNPILQYLLLLIIGCMILLAFVGCKSMPQFPTPSGTHESSRDSIRTELRIDTVYQDRWHKEYVKGDTVFIHDSIDRWRIHEVYIHDSIDISRIDTIYQKVEVERKGDAFLRNSGIALWVILAIIFLAVIVGIVLKFAK